MDYTNLLIIDCKTTLWEKPADMPAGQNTEIICVDIALVDTNKNQITDKEVVLVRPKQSKVSDYCEQLFGIKQSQLDACGVPFEEIYRKLRINYMSKDRLVANWGSYEKYAFDKQCRISGLENLFCYQFLNIQHLYSLMMGFCEKDAPAALSTALKNSGITSTGNVAADVAGIYMLMAKGLRPAQKNKNILGTKFNHFN